MTAVATETEDDGDGALRLSRVLVALHAGGVVLLLFVVISTTLWISAQHNKLAREASIRLVEAALQAQRSRAFALVTDYSIWDEGYQAVLTDDRDWLYSNIGVGATDIGSFDLMLLALPQGGPAFGWMADSPPEGEVGLLPEPLVNRIVSLLDTSPANFWTRTMFAEFDGDPWIFAVSRMTPIDGRPAGVPDTALPIQIHGYRLDKVRLDSIGASILNTNLRFSPRTLPGLASVPLADSDGRALTHVVWAPPVPGAQILRQVAVPLAVALAVATAISAFSARYAVRSAQRLEHALYAAKAADRSKTEFLSNVSHELRTPLNGIIGAVQLLEMTDLDDEQRELVSVLQISGSAQLALITDLLDWTRLEGGNRHLVEMPFEPVTVLQDVSEMIRVAAARKNIAFTSDFDSLTGLRMVGDSRALRQIITNLLGNAVKFTDRGRVELRAELEKGTDGAIMVLRVIDTGCGIPDHAQEKIFDRFYQVDGSLTRTGEGTGLGLAISRKLAGLIGGRISVESRLGAGSTFTLRVPVRPVHPSSDVLDAA